ncbi:hypothetical protein MUY27_14885 [Mucilaginibacter sp. RS28]|uniref:Uncharacterized protein n=1 Tax=Mucilaginibacter straminoryzae TaxID=2932774 RepID=A0A9X1X4K6_9SPHI|nr:hypothetical protein [Mucilaginibacter straminoryzae]MCJ8211002.1 hypothetical protein [Mucilaginibacter straminoryzae]
MKKTAILAVCNHEGILATILRLLAGNEQWEPVGAADLTQATDLLSERHFDIVLLGSGMDEQDNEVLKKQVPHVPVIEHYGGGSGLLFGEIYQALGRSSG